MYRHLEQLVPEARLTIAHGQMPEHQLSERMQEFTNGDVDVLLSTSIIESGLDIPNANTLIVDRADAFGLAQLYQLRGGWARRPARLCLLPAPRPASTDPGRAGSAWKPSPRTPSLERVIRSPCAIWRSAAPGSPGHAPAWSYRCGWLSPVQPLASRCSAPNQATVRQTSRDDGHLSPATPANVDLPLPASIPASYVTDKVMRLRLYRRIAALQSVEEVDALVEEFKDRFGPLPEPVQNLLYQLKIRLLAERAGLASISSENNQFALRYPDNEIPDGLPDLGPVVRLGKTASGFHTPTCRIGKMS